MQSGPAARRNACPDSEVDVAKEGVRRVRRSGRWVTQRVSDERSAPPAPARPVPAHMRGARRSGGRWVPPSETYADRHRAGRWILSRWWLLVVPFLGVMWANSSYVRPVVADIDSALARERSEVLDHQDEARSRRDLLQSEIHAITTEIDTLYQPMVSFHQALHDSLVQMRHEQESRPQVTQATVDSLLFLRSELAAEAQELRRDYWSRSSVLANLDAWQGALRDSMEMIEARALAMEEETEEPEPRGLTIRSVATRVGYVLAPILGYLWVQDS